MSLHAGGPIGTRPGVRPHQLYRTVVAEGMPQGFRHLALKGRFRPATTGNRQAMAERCARLAARMTACLHWGEIPIGQQGLEHPIRQDQPDLGDNPYLPSGYTYLLQFIAHDMVSTRLPFWATRNLDQETANTRSHRLLLDALYGDGPEAMRMIYAPAGPEDLNRTKLRIGRSSPIGIGNGAMVCPFRDVARVPLADTPADRSNQMEPLIADPRNDDHPLISQLTMVFSHLHNIFIDLQGAEPEDAPTLDITYGGAKRFAAAREATAMVYRRVVRDDLLKRILHPAVHALYSTGTPPFLDALGGARSAGVPLEFSHAALRFGHAMVKDSYRINDISPTFGQSTGHGIECVGPAAGRGTQTMPATWLVQWSNFFDVPGVTDPNRINLSRRIGPATPASLSAAAIGPIDPSGGAGIFYRDLVSGQLANVWPVRDLLAAMREHEALAPIVHGSTLLREEMWQQEIAAWLRGGDFEGAAGPWDLLADGVGADDVTALSLDPPLLFFLLFEAFRDPESQGCRLGRFGSILVADPLFAELNNRLPAEQRQGSLAEQLGSLHPAFGTTDFEGPMTMTTIIRFVDRHLQASNDPAMRHPSLL
jgi:hypothetical protein